MSELQTHPVSVPLTTLELQAAAARIREALGRGLLELADAGRELVAAKARLPHGTWLKWLGSEVEITVRVADQLMRLGQMQPDLLFKLATVANLSPGVAFELANPSMPRAVHDGVVNGAIRPTLREVREASRQTRGAGYRGSSPARQLDVGTAARRFCKALESLDEACDGSDERAGVAVAHVFREIHRDDPGGIVLWAGLIQAIADAVRTEGEVEAT